MKKIKSFNQFVNESKEQKELDQIQKWLKTTTEEFDDWDWDGETLTILLDGEAIETYSKADLEKEKVFKG